MKFVFRKYYKLNSYITLQLWKFMFQIEFMPYTNNIGISISADIDAKSIYLDVYPFQTSVHWLGDQW